MGIHANKQARSRPISVAPELIQPINYSNEPPISSQSERGSLWHERGSRCVGAAARRSRLLCAGCPPDERSGTAQLHNAPFFYFSTSLYCQRAAVGGFHGRGSMNSRCCTAVAMDLGVCQLRNFSISFLSSVLAKECASVRVDNR